MKLEAKSPFSASINRYLFAGLATCAFLVGVVGALAATISISGAVIAQARVPVFEDDTPDSLSARVLVQEHRLYPEVISWFAQGRLQLQETQALLDGKPIAF